MTRDFARELLLAYPAARWLWLLWIPISALAMFACLLFVRAIAPAARPEVHWTENARRMFPARSALGSILIVGLLLPLLVDALPHDTAYAVPISLIRASKVLGALIGWLLGVGILFRRYGVPVVPTTTSTPSWGASLLSLTVLRSLHFWGALAIAILAPSDATAFVVIPTFGVFVVWYVVRGNILLACALGLARPLSPEFATPLRRFVEPECALYELRTTISNAFALPGPSPAIIVSSGALRLLTPDELATIVRHERGHLREASSTTASRTVISTGIALTFASAPLWFRWWDVFGIFGLLLLMLSVIVVMRVIFRNTEKEADEHGAEEDPVTYARTLERLYYSNGLPAVLAGRGGLHGHLYDRMERSGVRPDYPRPRAPRRAWEIWAVAPLLIVVALYGGWPSGDVWALGFYGQSRTTTMAKAHEAFVAGDLPRSLTLYGFACQLHPHDVDAAANLAIVASHAKDCGLSREAAGTAKQRLEAVSPTLASRDESSLVEHATYAAEHCPVGEVTGGANGGMGQ